MKHRNQLVVQLMDESGDNVKVFVRDQAGNVYPIDEVRYTDAVCPDIMASQQGPIAHNEAFFLLELGPVVRQKSLRVK